MNTLTTPPRRRGPIMIVVVMGVLFVALLLQILSSYDRWSKQQSGGTASRSTATAAKPASAPQNDATDHIINNLPGDTGFAARNLEWGGNLTLLEGRDGDLLQMGDAEHRMAETIHNIPGERLAEKATQMPKMAELIANPQLYRGSVFTMNVLPFEINDHTTDVPAGRVVTWRMYAMAQRSEKEFVVFETLEKPPMRDWTLKRDVVAIDAVFLRTATYKTARDKDVVVPYFIPKNYSIVTEDLSAPTPPMVELLSSKWGPAILGGLAVFVLLTIWTVRRHNRQMEKIEKAHFYRMLKDKKRPVQKP